MLLARHAEAAFWMARYVERAENLARLLDVQQVFASDSRDPGSWRSMLLLNSDEARFLESHGAVGPRLGHAILCAGPGQSDIDHLRDPLGTGECARAPPADLDRDVDAAQHLPPQALCADPGGSGRGPPAADLAMVKEGCQAHTGITDGTFFRDEAWHFYWLGRWVERADQTTGCSISNITSCCRAAPMLARPSISASGTRCCAPPPAITPIVGCIRNR